MHVLVYTTTIIIYTVLVVVFRTCQADSWMIMGMMAASCSAARGGRARSSDCGSSSTSGRPRVALLGIFHETSERRAHLKNL